MALVRCSEVLWRRTHIHPFTSNTWHAHHSSGAPQPPSRGLCGAAAVASCRGAAGWLPWRLTRGIAAGGRPAGRGSPPPAAWCQTLQRSSGGREGCEQSGWQRCVQGGCGGGSGSRVRHEGAAPPPRPRPLLLLRTCVPPVHRVVVHLRWAGVGGGGGGGGGKMRGGRRHAHKVGGRVGGWEGGARPSYNSRPPHRGGPLVVPVHTASTPPRPRQAPPLAPPPSPPAIPPPTSSSSSRQPRPPPHTHLHDKERGVGDDAPQGAAVERGEAPGALQHVLALVQRLDGLGGEQGRGASQGGAG